MTGDPSDDLIGLVRELLRAIPSEAVADIGIMNEGLLPPRLTPVGASKFKQKPEDIDRALAEERKARSIERSKPAHAEPAAKRRTVGRPSQSDAPPDGLNLAQAFSIAGAKARKRREKLEKFGPGQARGMHRRRKRPEKGQDGAETGISNCGPLPQRVPAPKDQGS